MTQALTRANARKLAQNRGAGWGITTIQTLSATQLLFTIEYATFNSQAAIGDGNNNSENTIHTGSTASLGNTTGSTSSGGVSYRGEENLWGNLSFFIDGLNIDGNKYEIVDDTITSLTAPDTQGWINNFGYDVNGDYLFCPSAIGGSSALPIGDFMVVSETHARNRIAIGGGNYKDVTRPGLFYLLASLDPTWHGMGCGARLIYIPQLITAT